MKTVRFVLALLALSLLAPLQSAKAADVICYNCPPEWADWASMRKGAIAQIGTPREIYFKPKNRFVAEFIGAANIIEAPVENGHLVLRGGRQPIGGDASLAAAVVMIRPETIRVVEAGGAPLSGIIDSVSFIGDRQRMIVSGASDKLLTVDAPNTVRAQAGERIGLLIAPDAVRLLPPEN